MRAKISWFLFFLLFSACSSIPASKSDRKGWLESLGDLPQSSHRNPSFAADQAAAQKSNSSSEVNQDSPFDRVRLARWARVVNSLQLSWPLKSVQVTSEFGFRNGEPHEGIDFRASVGTPVYASHDGVVLYSGAGIRGYGKLVVLKHASGVSTVYAHNSLLFAKKGQRIRRGHRIALSGATGKSTGPHLHFEVRTGLKAVDPLRFLGSYRPPKMRRPGARSSRSTLAAAASLR